MKLADVIGQEDVKQHLCEMLRQDRVPHALMLCGHGGVGKLPMALSMASLLLCHHPQEDEPCGTCPACRMLQNWAHPDLHFSFPVYKAKSTDHPVSDDYLPAWRDQLLRTPYFDTEDWLNDIKAENQQILIYVQESDSLQRKLALKSNQGGRKVVIMWLPERMMEATANKLLKLIEEPPPHTHFLLVCQQPERVLGTIQSRVQTIHVPMLSEKDIQEALVQRKGLTAEQAATMAHIAQGSYTRAQKKLQEGAEEGLFLELFIQLMRACYIRQIKSMQQWTQKVAELGRERQKRMLEYFQNQVRENFVKNFRLPQICYQTEEERNFSSRFAPFVNERNVIKIMNELSDAQRDIEQNVNPKMVFFDLSLKITVLLKQ